jgi:hypothetical protein
VKATKIHIVDRDSHQVVNQCPVDLDQNLIVCGRLRPSSGPGAGELAIDVGVSLTLT